MIAPIDLERTIRGLAYPGPTEEQVIREMFLIAYAEGYAKACSIGYIKGLESAITITAGHAGAMLTEEQCELLRYCDDDRLAERWLRELLETGSTAHIRN